MQRLLQEIESAFDREALCNPAPLALAFLPGFHSQYLALIRSGNGSDDTAPETEWTPQGRSEKYGCLLAVADYLEQCAASGTDGDLRRVHDHTGAVTAQRLLPDFTRSPCRTWVLIHGRLLPYLERLERRAGQKGGSRSVRLLRWAESRFTPEERRDNTPLDRRMLNGYYRTRGLLFSRWMPPGRPDCGPQSDSREAVYGRLLGLENRIERFVMDHVQAIPPEQYRVSNAQRSLARFALRPAESWTLLRIKLESYLRHLPPRQQYLSKALETLEAALSQQDPNGPLGGDYLYYYYLNDGKEYSHVRTESQD